ncbi:hypothetical protein HPG69_001057 [Diceros bicornis minor]|uniref:Uncharacterized protein n=1 Tax=Diceros bicornis minor TaxID=77932 RepID=A0A7J7E5K7_DICBM|nr:hypothetical protein HPG69_001057 [Diceros bicornis minor]
MIIIKPKKLETCTDCPERIRLFEKLCFSLQFFGHVLCSMCFVTSLLEMQFLILRGLKDNKFLLINSFKEKMNLDMFGFQICELSGFPKIVVEIAFISKAIFVFIIFWPVEINIKGIPYVSCLLTNERISKKLFFTNMRRDGDPILKQDHDHFDCHSIYVKYFHLNEVQEHYFPPKLKRNDHF